MINPIKLELNKQGFITNWLVSGLKEEAFHTEQHQKHQIKYEQYLRRVGIDAQVEQPCEQIRLGKVGVGECTWRYYHSKNNWFVDLSSTYQVPTKIEAYAATELVVEQYQCVDVSIWAYAAVEIWVNHQKVCLIPQATYKPIQKLTCQFNLNPGSNTVFVRMQNVGVRDTRNIFGIQLQQPLQDVKVNLPYIEGLQKVLEVETWLKQVTYQDGKLNLTNRPLCEFQIETNGVLRTIGEDWYTVDETMKVLRLKATVDEQLLTRTIEIAEHWKPLYMDEATLDATHEKIYAKLGEIPYQQRSGGARFSVFHVLARYATNTQTEEDRVMLLEDLTYIERRVDCSDFLVVGFIRLMKNYALDDVLLATIKETLLSYRYWMDEEGTDGMCFWSENHSLMFNSSQMLVGEMYSEAIFTRSGRSGKEQMQIGKERCIKWLEQVEQHGFEEFISATYTAVTVIGLLNLIDFAEEAIATRAKILLDDVLGLLSYHIFDGVIIGPQGRVYRDVIYPFKQSAQALVHFINKALPTVVEIPGSECMWLACLATSSYQLPVAFIEKMGEEVADTYTADHAEINIKKTKDYILTSVTSPREGYEVVSDVELEPFSAAWVKEMNVRYHGKTLFEPGVYGYQQHLWYAALTKDCAVFANHPGTSTDDADMRPGYWYGNGVFPAVRQKDDLLGTVFSIPKEHPIHFTHLYWPTQHFDETKQVGKWLFGRRNNGFIGVWCSGEYEAFDDVLIDREYRVFGSCVAYVCKCGAQKEYDGFEGFVEACVKMIIKFDEENLKLDVENELSIHYVGVEDLTQYI